MNTTGINNWKAVEAEILSRIHSRQWQPGQLIPNEAELAEEFGCARTTVNRALRSIAENGLLDRKRKAGTRVATNPVRRATLSIPVLREEIESKNQAYSYAVLSSKLEEPPFHIRANMRLKSEEQMLHHQSVHMADGKPYVLSDRWVNLGAVPDILNADFANVSANEWLVANAPFTNGDIAFSATIADESIAEKLGTKSGEALFAIDRTTWNNTIAITAVKLIFHPGYQMRTVL